MAGAFLAGGSAALIAAFTAIPLPGGGDGLHPGGPQRSGGWRGTTILLRDAKPPLFGRRRKIVGPRHCKPAQGGAFADRRLRQIAAREGRTRGSFLPGPGHTAAV